MKTDTAPTDNIEAARLRNEVLNLKDRNKLLEENLKNRELNLDALEKRCFAQREKIAIFAKMISESPPTSQLEEELYTTHAAHKLAVMKWDAAVKQADTYRRHWDAKSNEVENEQRYNRQLKQQVYDLETAISTKNSLIATRDADLTRLSVEINNLRNTVKETQPTVAFWKRKAEEASYEAVSLKEKDLQAENSLIKQVQLLQDQLNAAAQKHDAYKKKVLEAGYFDQSLEVKRLKARVNFLISEIRKLANISNCQPFENT